MLELKDFPDRKTLETFKAKFGEMDLNGLESWLSILGVASLLEERLNNFLQSYNLKQSRFFILILLARNLDGITPSALAEGIGVSKPTMTGILTRMEKAELLIYRDAPHTRREKLIHISTKGQALLEKILPAHYTRVANFMKDLTKKDHEELKKILFKINFSGGNS